MTSRTKRRIAYGVGTVVVLGLVAVVALQLVIGTVMRQLSNGKLEAADYWSDEPAILSGGMGFDNIIGLPQLDEPTVRDAGGSWFAGATCANGDEPATSARTSAALSSTLSQAYVGSENVAFDDGLPVVFSWPVATETMGPTDFEFTMNTGEVVYGHAAGMNPNWENGERNTVVLFGDFGNRGKASEPDAVFPVKLEIVADDTPLTLISPDGTEVSAVGLTWTTETSPYDAGPVLVGAKLNRVGDAPVGEGGVTLIGSSGLLPNDEFALYGGGDFRLRVLTTGGFSPDGVTGLQPDMYEDFFRVHATGPDGETVTLDEVGVNYEVRGGTLRVIGLSDLGQVEDPESGVAYDDCYAEDRDNYIDIILEGDDDAARHITHIEIPSLEGGYRAFYNPGGPGPEPFEGIRYTAPGPPDLEPVLIALDDPMRVSRAALSGAFPAWSIAAGLGLLGVLTALLVRWILRRRTAHRSAPA
jgi:hypothetical protein